MLEVVLHVRRRLLVGVHQVLRDFLQMEMANVSFYPQMGPVGCMKSGPSYLFGGCEPEYCGAVEGGGDGEEEEGEGCHQRRSHPAVQ